MKRTCLRERMLPVYSRGEEIMNTVTHICGGGLAIIGSLFCMLSACRHGGWAHILGAAVYAVTMICVYTMSSIYHGLRPGMGKKVMQVLDHCAIYFLIAGTYTVIVLSAIRPVYPWLGWGLFAFEWAMTALATTLTAIDLKKYEAFSMVCYIGMGWAVIPFWRQTLEVMTLPGFLLLLSGGIAYTIGSILYGIGIRRKWMHSVFHIFVVIGALLQYLAVLLYAI